MEGWHVLYMLQDRPASRSEWTGMEVLKPVEEDFFADEYLEYSHVFRWIKEPYTMQKTRGP